MGTRLQSHVELQPQQDNNSNAVYSNTENGCCFTDKVDKVDVKLESEIQ